MLDLLYTFLSLVTDVYDIFTDLLGCGTLLGYGAGNLVSLLLKTAQ